ncbi:S4 domain-containing protein [Luteimonas sp. FXH3W]|uniref:S4 domain-containing protein n=1 Tax=Aquilutibacter rugosus TaxID=3115820 RepID=A0ABU7V2V1_9GAMM
MEPTQELKVRLDLWLWATRFFKTRALAKQAIETGKVEIAGERPKASRQVKLGDALVIRRGIETFYVTVTGLLDQRVAYAQAVQHYSETEESVAAREKARAEQRAQATGYRAPETKPDKRARRLIRALGDLEML